MGFWGTTLFSNDTTCDVRDTYEGLLSDQLSNEEAYKQTIEQCSEIIHSDEEPLFWFALAATQWTVGRLRQEVKAKALEWIAKDGGAELWEDNPKGAAGWQKTLQKLKEKLEQPPPKEKKFTAPQEIRNNPWNLYDIYAFQLYGKKATDLGLLGKYILLQKIGEGDCQDNGICMRIHIFDSVFDEMPSLRDAENLRLLPLSTPRVSARGHGIDMDRYIYMDKKALYPGKYLTFLGNQPCAPSKMECDDRNNDWSLNWDNLEYYFCKFYFVWQGLKYEVTKEGEGWYKNPKGKLEGHGFGLFVLDEIFEVREAYVSALCKGLSSQAAFEKTRDVLCHDYLGKNKEPLFWYALADVQWDLGSLLSEVRSEALKWIAKNGGLDLYEQNSYERDDWEETLENLKFKLKEVISPWPCPVLKLRQQQKPVQNRWKIDDIYAYQLHGENAQKAKLAGKYILLQKIGAHKIGVGALTKMVVHSFDCLFDHLPVLSNLEGLRILPLGFPKIFSGETTVSEGAICMNQAMSLREEGYYPVEYLTYIGNRQGPANREYFSSGRDNEWQEIDDQLVECYEFWQGKEYRTVEDGIYRYFPK